MGDCLDLAIVLTCKSEGWWPFPPGIIGVLSVLLSTLVGGSFTTRKHRESDVASYTQEMLQGHFQVTARQFLFNTVVVERWMN